MNKIIHEQIISRSSIKPRLGEALIEQGSITEDQLEIALKEQHKRGGLIGELLVSLGFMENDGLNDILSELTSCEHIDIRKITADIKAISMISRDVAMGFGLVPVSYDENKRIFNIAMANVYDLQALDHVKGLIGNQIDIKPLISSKGDIDEAIARFYGYDQSIDEIIKEIKPDEIVSRIGNDIHPDSKQPIVRLVETILIDALKKGASDIHFEPENNSVRLRYRIDGVLKKIRSIHKDIWSALSIRIKIISSLNIAESSISQDGAFTSTIFGRKIDFRVSVLPVLEGENIVIRILDRSKAILPLSKLSSSDRGVNNIKRLMASPDGLIIITGPTGSGKTSTLYSMISHLNRDNMNIMTLEDPVEYPVSGIRQTSVNRSNNIDFINGIKSILRQDPDIIVIGEMRDEGTVDMAFKAAMTGHKVFSTFHARSSLGAIKRLQELGIKKQSITENITGIISQRLLRRLCQNCKIPRGIIETEKNLLRIDEDISLYEPKGCGLCNDTGYDGRVLIKEELFMDEEVSEWIMEDWSLLKIKRYMRKQGFTGLGHDAMRMIINGMTSLDEVCRNMYIGKYI